MARNRFPEARLASGRALLAATAREAWRFVRPALLAAVILSAVGGVGVAVWQAAGSSAYFKVRTIEVSPTTQLTRAEVLALAGLDTAVNTFQFDTAAARAQLQAHPWIARAEVTKRLPNRVSVEIQERAPAGVLVLDELYLVDGAGAAFVAAQPAQVAAYTLVTGMDRSFYEAEPAAAQAQVREALAVARLYARHSLSDRHPLSNVHLGDGGRIELQLSRTRVVLGHENWNKKLTQLERIFEQLQARNMDAAYVLLSEDLERAIVKEIPTRSAISASLRVGRPEGARN